MRKTLAFLAVASLVVVPASAQQPKPVSAQTPGSMDDVLKAVRGELQESRADIMAKNLTLTSGQAAKFWPMFESYQKEQNLIIDEQMKSLQKYAESYNNLDDAAALAFIDANLDRDAKMSVLRKKWLAEFQGAVGVKVAVRVMQIDRQLSLAHQLLFAAKIPLVY